MKKPGFLYRCLVSLAYRFVRLLLSLRYNIQVKGLPNLMALRESRPGILFLPNHPAEIDPVILQSLLGPLFFPRSVVVEHFYHLKGFKILLDLARVVPVPSMAEKANRWRAKELQKVFSSIVQEIREGEHFLIYPSGKLKRSGWEKLGGASFVHNLLQEGLSQTQESKEEIPVVLIRTTGLWGSSFSVAQTGESPSFGKTLTKAVKALLKNGIFFMPRRTVQIEFELASADLPRKEGRLVFNRYLEDWYNRYPFFGAEPLSLVPYTHFQKEEEIPVHLVQENNLLEEEKIQLDAPIQQEIYKYLASIARVDVSSLAPHLHLSTDLGLDSLDVAQIYLFLDRKFGITQAIPGSLERIKDVFLAVAEEQRDPKDQKNKTPRQKNHPTLRRFNQKEKRKDVLFLPGHLLMGQLFLASCDRMGSLIACGDRTSGVFSYRELKRAAWIFAEQIRSKCPGKYVGVLLPSSVAAYLTILSLFLSGKIPVMLNWTAGKAALGHAVKVSGIQTVITSKKFLDKVQLEDLSELEDLFVFLEEIKEGISFKQKLTGVFKSFLPWESLARQLPLEQDPDQTAVLLFTSGTESLPKAVPLSHRQILVNEQGTLACADLGPSDVLYGVLPPFHSFGFSLTGLFPLLSGMKVFYGSDPTDGRSMAYDVEEARITLFCSAPSFIRTLFAAIEIDILQKSSLRLLVAGAEKMPNDVESFVASHLQGKVKLLEGYGITECAPVVTLQRMDEERKGVGRPLPGVKISIVDPLSLEPLEIGKEGEVCISGPSVFDGYMKHSANPFFYRGKERWYRSGDLGKLDQDGCLYLTDRLKRIMKIGGEMVSLGGVEDELLQAAKKQLWYPSSHEGPPLALVAREGGDQQKAELVLFTAFDVSRDAVNQVLRESGFGRIVKISEIIRISEIPLTGTGKIHHRILEERLLKTNVYSETV